MRQHSFSARGVVTPIAGSGVSPEGVWGKILLRGRPGVGKTTLVKNLACALKEEGKKVFGFWTEEIREKGIRVGFKVANVEGKEEIMAHVEFNTPHRVSKYRVDITAFERIALPELARGKREEGIIIIDEIGKMELFSERFKEAVKELFTSGRTLVATIPISSLPFITSLSKMATGVIEITPSNREKLLGELKRMICELES